MQAPPPPIHQPTTPHAHTHTPPPLPQVSFMRDLPPLDDDVACALDFEYQVRLLGGESLSKVQGQGTFHVASF